MSLSLAFADRRASKKRLCYSKLQSDGFLTRWPALPRRSGNTIATFLERFGAFTLEDLEQKRRAVDLAFMRQGITFNVYGDSQGAERIFPFDLLPRIIPAGEWEQIERGLVQRITALNLFLHDIYHEQRILKDGVIPPFYVLSAKHFRRSS